MFLLALLTAGNANAGQQPAGPADGHGGGLSGLLGTVTESAESVGTVVDSAVAPVTREVARVVEPVTEVVTPVVRQTVRTVQPVLTEVSGLAEPVIQAVTPVVAPVTRPLLREVSQLAGPVVQPVVEPVVRAVVPVEERSIVPTPVAAAADPAVAGAVPVAVTAGHLPVPSAVRTTGARVTPVAEAAEWRTATVPFAPLAPPTDPALAGTSSGVTAAPHGPGVDGPVLAGGGVLRSPAGSWRAPPGVLIGPSWWTSYARQHPS